MIFNSVIYENSMPSGMGTLEVIDKAKGKKRLFVPLSKTTLTGVITGPLATFQLTQEFGFSKASFNHTIEAIYRFPLPSDAMITGVQVSFGEEILKTILKEREDAADEYHAAFEQGRKGVLLTRETPDIFTLHITGIEPDNTVTVEISFLQYAQTIDSELAFRIPLTVAPRYIRDDEMSLSQRNATPQLMLLDPGHTFSADLIIHGNPVLKSPSHAIITKTEGETVHITLQDTEVIPDRDFVLICNYQQNNNAPHMTCQIEKYPDENVAYLLTTISSPKPEFVQSEKRELIILVDHSGSMRGPKWQAADWTVKNLLKTIQPDEVFNLGVFHDSATWLSKSPISGTEQAVSFAIQFLKKNQDSGGTNLGIVLEQALKNPKIEGPYVRHIIIITDAEVTDEGRLIRMVKNEQMKKDPRSVSVICIDAAPNGALVSELVRVGKGIARFLTSDPSEQDITTALNSALISWKQPYKRNQRLIFNREKVESIDEIVNGGEISLPSIPLGTFSAVYRVPLEGEEISITLEDSGGEEVAKADIIQDNNSGIRRLFGSARIRTLEQIQGGFYSNEELKGILQHFGYQKEQNSLYPEENGMNGVFLDELIVRESLLYGIPSSRTAFVCTSAHPGTPVKASVLVPSAQPAGWDVVYNQCIDYSRNRLVLRMEAPPASIRPAPALECMEMPGEEIIIARARVNRAPNIMASPPRASAAHHGPSKIDFTIPVHPENGEIRQVIDLPSWNRITGIRLIADVLIADIAEMHVEIYHGSRSAPVAFVKLGDLFDGEIRPLNIACKGIDKLTIVLTYPEKISIKTDVRVQIQGEGNSSTDINWM